MSKGKRYKKSKIRLNNFLVFYVIIVFFTFINYTFSRYTVTSEGTGTISVAKFNIAVNEQNIGQTESFELKLTSSNSTFNNKIVPGSEGYFEISINPTETQVSLEYEIAFDLTEVNSENRTISLTEYSLDEGATKIAVPTDNKIVGEINLEEGSNGFKQEDTVNLRVYWEWADEEIINPTFEYTAIQVKSIIKQKLASGSENV